jgi:predicted ester cyclase
VLDANSTSAKIWGVPLEVAAEDRPVVDADYGSHTERIKALITHYFMRVWNEGKVELTELMWDPEIVFHSPVATEPVVGRDALLVYVSDIQSAFSELRFEAEDVIAEGDRVVMRVTQTGVQSGEYFGVPPTGRRVAMSEIFIFRASEGGPLGAKVEEIWLLLNALDLMQQLKLFPKGQPPRPLLRLVIAIQKLTRR